MGYQSWSVVFGEQPSATKWNILGTNDASFNDGTGIADATISPAKWTNPYCFGARATSQTTLGDNTDVQVLFATEDYDYNNNFASSTYTAPIAGVYHFDAVVGVAGSVSSGLLAYISLRKNDSTLLVGTQDSLGSNNQSYIISADILLAANDTVKVYFFQNSGGNEASTGDGTRDYFNGHLIRQTPS